MKKKRILILTIVTLLALSISGCGLLKSNLNSIKGDLLGVAYNINFYDDFGNKFLEASGKKIDITGNVVKEQSVDSDGQSITNYSLSSVITITIDGKQMESCGNTVIFTEKGLKPDVNFSLKDINSNSNGISNLTSISKVVNKYKNYFGKAQIVVIQSQLGVPICAYSGQEVTWTIPNHLPKTTKLMIDGKSLYIHRAKFEIIDKELLD